MTDIFLDIKSAPVDVNIPPDVKDLADPPKTKVKTADLQSFSALDAVTRQKAFIIPFGRTIKEGTIGKDVKGIKRPIWRALGLPVPFLATSYFGPTAVRLLKIFQKKHHLQVDGVVGPQTLAALAPYFDSYAFLLYEGYAPGKDPRRMKEAAFVAYALWGYNNRSAIHYFQSRPMSHLNDLKHLPIWEDCSEFFTKVCKFAGLSDPNGLGFNGSGWTGTIGNHGTRLSDISQAKPGAAILYGPYPDFEHVSCYIGNNRVVSHGSEGGPYLLPYNYRGVAEIRQF